MKLRFSYWDISQYVKNDDPDHRKIRRAFEMIDTSERTRNSYGQYLLSSLNSDFSENRFGSLDKILEKIDQTERGDIASYYF
jgi:hypothetical protein